MGIKAKGSKINPNIKFSKKKYYKVLNEDNFVFEFSQRVSAMESSPHFTDSEKAACIRELMDAYTAREAEAERNSGLIRETLNAYIDHEIEDTFILLRREREKELEKLF